MSDDASSPPAPAYDSRSELRIALAMSGAIALVLYEAGVSHEVWRLYRAGQFGASSNDPYRRALDQAGLDPVIDILTGASAGGINSVFLASCIVTDTPFDTFHDLWIDVPDVSRLKYKAGEPPKALLNSGVLADAMRKILRANAAPNRATPSYEVPELAVRLCRTHLRGQCVSTVDAIGHSVDFTTRSDVVAFGENDFRNPDKVEELVKAALATSAFPILFQPVEDQGRYYVDGGLWDNQPIDLAVEAIRDKPAFGKTQRCVIFVEPDPSLRTNDAAETEPTVTEAGLALPFMGIKGNILPAVEEILTFNARRESYMDFMDSLAETPGVNELIPVYATNQFEAADQELKSGEFGDRPTRLNTLRIFRYVLGANPRLAQAFRQLPSQFAFLPNGDDSLGEAVRRLLDARCLAHLATIDWLDLRHRAIRRRIEDLNKGGALEPIERMARKALLYEGLKRIDAALMMSPAEARNTRGGSTGYVLNTFESVPRPLPGAEAVAERLASLHSRELAEPRRSRDELESAVKEIVDGWSFAFTFPAPVTSEDVTKASEGGSAGSPLGRAFRKVSFEQRRQRSWASKEALIDRMNQVLAEETYLAFSPSLLGTSFEGIDVLRHFLAGVSDLENKSKIDLIRISPNDTNNLHLIGKKPISGKTDASIKLAGEELGHISGFLERRWRRNDYIWGRLDAAEILLRTVQRYAQAGGRSFPDETYRKLLAEVQEAILKSEAELYNQSSAVKEDGVGPVDADAVGVPR